MLGLFQKSVPVFVLDLEGHQQVLAEIDQRLKLAQQFFRELQTWPTPLELWKKSWEPNEFGVFQQPELSPRPKSVISVEQKNRQAWEKNIAPRRKSGVFTHSGLSEELVQDSQTILGLGAVNPQAYPVKYIPARCCKCGLDLMQGRALVNGDKVYCDQCNPSSSTVELMNYFTLTSAEVFGVGDILRRDGRLYKITEIVRSGLGTRVQARRLY